MKSIGPIIAAIVTLSLSGIPTLFGSRRSMVGQRSAAVLMALGSALGLWAIAEAMVSAAPVSLDAAWLLPIGRFSVSIDSLSAMFLAPVFVVPVLGAIYGLGYWKQPDHPANGRKLCLAYGLLAGSMAMVVIARDAVLFLISWEIMAVSAYFAATAEDDDPSVRRAGWVYLIATHLGTLCLIAMFALLRHASGSFAIQPSAADSIQPSMLSAIFVLAVIGFGFKAGLFPLHVWLPEAHANAPSHVSAVMSGVMLKMGVYGIVRIAALLSSPPAWWGGLLLGVGAASGILGIAFAIGQRDLKRLLAYSSIENVGIIMMGVGLAMVGRSVNRTDLVVLGMGGALFHVWNHSLFKSLLFLNAGAIIHGVHTREIDRMGGLARRMPHTAFYFLIGAVAICALPPLNGFAGEFLLYLGLFRSSGPLGGPAIPAAALGAAVLAMIGGLAVACFVKLFGAMFLGQPRSDVGRAAHDPEKSLTYPIAALAIGCIVFGLSPWLAAPMLDRAVEAWRGPASLAATPILELAPMGWISFMAGLLVAVSAMIGIFLLKVLGRQRAGSAGTWDCGYARPTARMQYTGSSFGQTLVGLFAWALWPKVDAPRTKGIFPQAALFNSVVPETILDRLVLPVFRFAERCLSFLRMFQQGSVQVYLVYFVAAVLVLLFWGRFGP